MNNEIARRYPPDDLANHPDGYTPDDDGTMPENVERLAEFIVGQRIVSVEENQTIKLGPSHRWRSSLTGLVLNLSNGVRVVMADSSDCCAYTELKSFLLHPDKVDHVIMGVASTEGYTRWHIYADAGDIMELTVGWSSGNPFYYGYGFEIEVEPLDGEVIEEAPALPGARLALPTGGDQ